MHLHQDMSYLIIFGGDMLRITIKLARSTETPALQTKCPNNFQKAHVKYTSLYQEKFAATYIDQTLTLL